MKLASKLGTVALLGLLGSCGPAGEPPSGSSDATGATEAGVCTGLCCGKSYGYWCSSATSELWLCSGYGTEVSGYRQRCANNCRTMPEGEDDVCNAAPATPSAGVTAFCRARQSYPGAYCQGDRLVSCAATGVETFLMQCSPGQCRDGGFNRPDYCASTAAALGAPQSLSPGLAVGPFPSVRGLYVTLSWAAVSGAQSYTVEWSAWNYATVRWDGPNTHWTNGTSVGVNLPRSTQYSWRVRASNGTSASAWSPSVAFWGGY